MAGFGAKSGVVKNSGVVKGPGKGRGRGASRAATPTSKKITAAKQKLLKSGSLIQGLPKSAAATKAQLLASRKGSSKGPSAGCSSCAESPKDFLYILLWSVLVILVAVVMVMLVVAVMLVMVVAAAARHSSI